MSEEDRRDIEAIDMDDPKLHDAAAKIQATFKGHRFRKSAADQTAQVRAAKAAATLVVRELGDPWSDLMFSSDICLVRVFVPFHSKVSVCRWFHLNLLGLQ